MTMRVFTISVAVFLLGCKDDQPAAPWIEPWCYEQIITGYGPGDHCPDRRHRLDVIVRHGLGSDAIYVCRCGGVVVDGGTR